MIKTPWLVISWNPIFKKISYLIKKKAPITQWTLNKYEASQFPSESAAKKAFIKEYTRVHKSLVIQAEFNMLKFYQKWDSYAVVPFDKINEIENKIKKLFNKKHKKLR